MAFLQPPSSPGHRPDLSIGFILSPSFTLTPLAGFVDALRLAADEGDRSRPIHCGWEFLAAERVPCRASCGLEVMPTETYGDPGEFDYIAVIGGLLDDADGHSPQTYAYLRKAAARGVPLIGLCTGGFVLAEAGLMDGLRCSVHFAVQQRFVGRFPKSIPVTDDNFVIDGGFITCPGSIAAIDLAAYLINRHCSQARAKKALNYLLVREGRPRLTLSTRPYEDKLLNAGRVTVDAVRIMELNIDRPFKVAKIAAMVNSTPTSLGRSFQEDLGQSPADFWRAMRLWHARHAVVNSKKSMTEISYETGFSDASHFCKSFKAAFNASPYEYRKKAIR